MPALTEPNGQIGFVRRHVVPLTCRELRVVVVTRLEALGVDLGARSHSSIGTAGMTHSASVTYRGRSPALPESTLILDGEVAILDEHLISRFEWFRQ